MNPISYQLNLCVGVIHREKNLCHIETEIKQGSRNSENEYALIHFTLPFSINLEEFLQIFGLNVYKNPKNDQVTFCCLLQHNVFCGRGQNHAYQHSFHNETLHGS